MCRNRANVSFTKAAEDLNLPLFAVSGDPSEGGSSFADVRLYFDTSPKYNFVRPLNIRKGLIECSFLGDQCSLNLNLVFFIGLSAGRCLGRGDMAFRSLRRNNLLRISWLVDGVAVTMNNLINARI